MSTLLTLLVVLASFLEYPRGSKEWDELLSGGGGYSYSKKSWIVIEQKREIFRAYKLTVFLVACVIEGFLLPRRLRSPQISTRQPQVVDPFLPGSFHLLDCYRLLFSIFEVVLWLGSLQDPWVSPGFGMYGWTVVWDVAMPAKNTISHMSLGALAAVLSTVWRLRPGLSLEVTWPLAALRFIYGAAFTVVFAYPIYDSKHYYGGSHMANLGGEWLPPYVFFSAVLTWCFWERFPMDCRSTWRFAKYFDRQVLVMLGVAIIKTTVDMLRCPGSWAAPSSRPVEGGCSDVSRGLWLKITLGLYFSIASIMFLYVEHSLWRQGHLEHESTCEMVCYRGSRERAPPCEPQ